MKQFVFRAPESELRILVNHRNHWNRYNLWIYIQKLCVLCEISINCVKHFFMDLCVVWVNYSLLLSVKTFWVSIDFSTKVVVFVSQKPKFQYKASPLSLSLSPIDSLFNCYLPVLSYLSALLTILEIYVFSFSYNTMVFNNHI